MIFFSLVVRHTIAFTMKSVLVSYVAAIPSQIFCCLKIDRPVWLKRQKSVARRKSFLRGSCGMLVTIIPSLAAFVKTDQTHRKKWARSSNPQGATSRESALTSLSYNGNHLINHGIFFSPSHPVGWSFHCFCIYYVFFQNKEIIIETKLEKRNNLKL